MPTLTINGQSYFSDSPPDTPLLWVIREELRLTGTKFGCGIAHVRRLYRAHQRPGGALLFGDARRRGQRAPSPPSRGSTRPDAHPVQQAWIELQVPQCGYCQSGQIMQAAALLAQNPNPTDQEIVAGMNGNLCRCATYPRIVGAVKRASQIIKETNTWLTRPSKA